MRNFISGTIFCDNHKTFLVSTLPYLIVKITGSNRKLVYAAKMVLSLKTIKSNRKLLTVLKSKGSVLFDFIPSIQKKKNLFCFWRKLNVTDVSYGNTGSGVFKRGVQN